jgi:hypothetical protein
MSSSVATVSAHDRTAPQDLKRILPMQTPDPSFDLLNPNVGWVIGPIAVATSWVEANLVHVDLSWAELLYSVAAVIYASAGLVTSFKERKQSKTSPTSTSSSTDTDKTIDLK